MVGSRPSGAKVVLKHVATAEYENCAYGPTLPNSKMSSDNSVPKIRTALCNFMRKTAHSVKPCQTTKCRCTFRLTYNKRLDKKKYTFWNSFSSSLLPNAKMSPDNFVLKIRTATL